MLTWSPRVLYHVLVTIPVYWQSRAPAKIKRGGHFGSLQECGFFSLEPCTGKPQVKIRLAFHVVGRRVNKHVTWLSDDDVLFRFRAQQRAKYSYYSSRPAVSQLYGISDTMWNCFGNQKPQRRQIVKRFNKMEQNDISLRLCQVLVSKEFDAYLPIETGRNKPSYPRGIYFSFIQTAGHFGIWGIN